MYGAIENTRLRVLVLADDQRQGQARAIARALSPRHEAIVLADKKRWLGRLSVARAATEFDAQLIHCIGCLGSAAAAGPVARGAGIPLIATLDSSDLSGKFGRRTDALARRADAVVLPTADDADVFRNAGIDRDLYVTSLPGPEADEGDRFFLGAIEVVYGRVANIEEAPKECDNLVTIGSVNKS